MDNCPFTNVNFVRKGSFMTKKTGLGRGIGALFSDIEEYDYEDEKSLVKNIKVTEIEPNKDQVRKIFDEEKLNELAESIKRYGVLQPIIVTKKNDYYEIVAGERRWRASIIAGLTHIPAIIKEDNEKDNAKISLIENMQRENLNPIERARGFKSLIEGYDLTVSDLARTLGLNSTRIKENIELLSLDKRVIAFIEEGKLPETTAKLILEQKDFDVQYELALYIIEDGLTAKEAKNRLKVRNRKERPKKVVEDLREYKALENRFSKYFNTKVKINAGKNEKGKIIIHYENNDDLERIIDLLK